MDLAQAAGVVVGCADDAHLAAVDEAGEGAEGFLQRGMGIVAMRLVEIDVIGLQAAQ
ncbi:hypothetical protein D3C80_1803420 [compost metagenome]